MLPAIASSARSGVAARLCLSLCALALLAAPAVSAAPKAKGSKGSKGSAAVPKDMERVNKIPKIAVAKGGKWSFKNAKGAFEFRYSSNTGNLKFTPKKSLTTDPIAWIQVARTGCKTRWFSTVEDINTLSSNNKNFLDRSDAVYGFRVDKTKGENVPFWEQKQIRKGTDLASYKLGFDIPAGASMNGATALEMSDAPDMAGGLSRMYAKDNTIDLYRFQFFAMPMNVKTGEIYGVIEWGEELRKVGNTQEVFLFKPALVSKEPPELKGRDLAFNRWNTIYGKNYKGEGMTANNADLVYPIPGEGTHWGKK